MKQHRQLNYSSLLIIIFFIATGLLLTACNGGAQAQETFTIGAVNYVPSLNAVFDGFKAGMAELGYVEGENVTYIYSGTIEPSPEVIDREVESLLAQDVDLIFTMGTLPTLRAKQAVKGTGVPVIFAPVINPVEEGIVDSIRQPGGSVTGVQNGITIAKALEWFLTVVPEATKVYVPYHPDDDVAVTSLIPLREAVSMLRVELVLGEVHSQEEVIAAIEALPDDTAIFIIPTPSLEPIGNFTKVATEQGIPVGSTNHSHLKKGALVTFGASFFIMGQQAAQLVDKALQGTKPVDMPVETAEFFLGINLQTAAALGREIPDKILEQAKTIIR